CHCEPDECQVWQSYQLQRTTMQNVISCNLKILSLRANVVGVAISLIHGNDNTKLLIQVSPIFYLNQMISTIHCPIFPTKQLPNHNKPKIFLQKNNSNPKNHRN
ncbi:MAG: hypothetical protein IK065_05150, partial [Neisseriaceae bacterium]|nr:hypothetical protein [Neisseriaceae bacterium]